MITDVKQIVRTKVDEFIKTLTRAEVDEFRKIIILTSDSFYRQDTDFVIRKRSRGIDSFIIEIRDLTILFKRAPSKQEMGQRLYMRCYRYFDSIHSAMNVMREMYPETKKYPDFLDGVNRNKEEYNIETLRDFYKKVNRPIKYTDSVKILKKKKVFNNLRNTCLNNNIPFESVRLNKITECTLFKYLLLLEKKYKEIPANRHFVCEGTKRKFTYHVYCKRFGNFNIALQEYKKWKKKLV